jgi:hypothetical protein
MFFKRLSRGSRSNSYAENDYDSHNSPRSLNTRPRDFNDQDYDRGLNDSPRGGTPQHNSYHDGPLSPTKESQRPDSSRGSGAGAGAGANMYPRSQAPADPYSRAGTTQGSSANRNSIQLDGLGPPGGMKAESAPDLLTRAFNEAVRPYTDKIEQLEQQLADLQGWVDTLERERSEMHGWIDKRGLRPGEYTSSN